MIFPFQEIDSLHKNKMNKYYLSKYRINEHLNIKSHQECHSQPNLT